MQKDGFPDPLFKPMKDTKLKNGSIEQGAIPLQAADLYAFELFDAMRTIEQGKKLPVISEPLSILDKICGEPHFTSNERVEWFSRASKKVQEGETQSIGDPDSPFETPDALPSRQ